MARNIQIPPRPDSSKSARRPEADTPQDVEQGKPARVEGIPRRPGPRPVGRSARPEGGSRPEEPEKEELAEGVTRVFGRNVLEEIPRPRAARIYSPRRRTIHGAAGSAESAEEMLEAYVRPPLLESGVLQPGIALRLLSAFLSKVLPKLKGNPNILAPAQTVFADEMRLYSDFRDRLHGQGFQA
jgi:hypothetical protein